MLGSPLLQGTQHENAFTWSMLKLMGQQSRFCSKALTACCVWASTLWCTTAMCSCCAISLSRQAGNQAELPDAAAKGEGIMLTLAAGLGPTDSTRLHVLQVMVRQLGLHKAHSHLQQGLIEEHSMAQHSWQSLPLSLSSQPKSFWAGPGRGCTEVKLWKRRCSRSMDSRLFSKLAISLSICWSLQAVQNSIRMA